MHLAGANVAAAAGDVTVVCEGVDYGGGTADVCGFAGEVGAPFGGWGVGGRVLGAHVDGGGGGEGCSRECSTKGCMVE